MARVHVGPALVDLVLKRRVGAEQELLAGLAAAVEGALDEHAAERAGGEDAAVLAVERHALGDGLVDDVGRELGEAPDVGLAGAEVAALHRVDEEAVDGVALVGVVLGRVDAALRGDRVGAPRAVLEAEGVDVVAGAGERCRGARAGEARADHDHLVVVALARPDQAMAVEPAMPLLGQRPLGDLGVEVQGLIGSPPPVSSAGRGGCRCRRRSGRRQSPPPPTPRRTSRCGGRSGCGSACPSRRSG